MLDKAHTASTLLFSLESAQNDLELANRFVSESNDSTKAAPYVVYQLDLLYGNGLYLESYRSSFITFNFVGIIAYFLVFAVGAAICRKLDPVSQ